MTTFSRLPTASLLCALEKEGYGKLVLLAFGDADEDLRSSSGMGMDVRRLEGVLGEVSVVEDFRRSLEVDLRTEREDLCRFSRGILSLSASRVFDEGMAIADAFDRGVNRIDSDALLQGCAGGLLVLVVFAPAVSSQLRMEWKFLAPRLKPWLLGDT